MLTYSEMLAIVDRHTTYSVNGRALVNVMAIRKELYYEWAFDEMQVQRAIYDMQDKGLLG